MIIGGFRVSLRGHRFWKAVSFSAGAMPKQGPGVGVEAELLLLPSWLLDLVSLGRLFHLSFPCLLHETSHASH